MGETRVDTNKTNQEEPRVGLDQVVLNRIRVAYIDFERRNLNVAYKKLKEVLEMEGPAQKRSRQPIRIRRENGAYIREDFWIIG